MGKAKTTDIEAINQAIKGHGTATIWQSKRIYVNPTRVAGSSYRGERDSKVWIDIATGEIHIEIAKGTISYDWHGHLAAIKEVL